MYSWNIRLNLFGLFLFRLFLLLSWSLLRLLLSFTFVCFFFLFKLFSLGWFFCCSILFLFSFLFFVLRLGFFFFLLSAFGAAFLLLIDYILNIFSGDFDPFKVIVNILDNLYWLCNSNFVLYGFCKRLNTRWAASIKNKLNWLLIDSFFRVSFLQDNNDLFIL